MARVFIWIGAISLVVLLSLVGSYLYYQQLAANAVAQLGRQLPDGLQLVYESVSADLSGRIAIDNAALLPTHGVGGASIERISLHTPGLTYLLTDHAQLASGHLPLTAQAVVEGVHLPLTPVTIAMVDRLVAEPLANHAGVAELLMACGGHAPLSLQQLYEMGITGLKSDLTVRYQHNPADKTIEAALSYRQDQLFDLHSEVQILSDAPVISSRMFEHYTNWLQQADFSYQDRGYHRQRNQYCASLDDDILDQYLKQHRERVVAGLRRIGWQISPELGYAYQRVISDRGDFALQLKPARAVMINELGPLPLADRWNRLAPQLRLGKDWVALKGLYQVVDSNTLVASIQQQTRLAAPGAGISDDEQRRRTREAIRRAVQGGQEAMPEKSYQPVEVARINEFIGHWVRLETYFGRKVHGTLERIEGNMLYVDQHMQQGSAVYPIDKTKLARLQVLH